MTNSRHKKGIPRKLSRLRFYILKGLLRLISKINHRFYMKYYIPLLKSAGMKITGMPRYIGINVVFDDFNLISLGDRVVISDESHFLTHDYSITTALIAINKPPSSDVQIIREIKVGTNVFIGKKSIIMPNTIIGNNVIVGAGSVVRGKIPDNVVVSGNPASIICDINIQANKWEKYLNSEFVAFD